MKIYPTTIQQQFKLSVFIKLMTFIASVVVFFSVVGLAFAQTEKRITNWQLMPKIDYTYWCVPTSQAMILGYYDNYDQGVGGFSGYGRLIDYWFDHPPYTSGSSTELHQGSNTPSYIDVIIDPNTDTWRLKPDGTSWSGAESFHMDNFGYSFSFQGVDCNKDDNDYCWNEIKSEIDNNRPLFFSGPGHTTAAFGYQITATGQKKVIVYNPPNPNTPTYIDYIDYDWCMGITKIIPLDEDNSDNLVIFSPDGGEELTQLDPYEITWYIWGNTIKSVDIDHSTDGGDTWESIATGIGAQSGTNSRFWSPTVTTNNGRIRIRGYSQDRSEYIAGDGSQNNFRVNTATGDELNWCNCSWQEIGGLESHQDLGNWCPPGTFLTQFDLDAGSGSGSDNPIVGRAKCCKLCAFEADSWGSCSWTEVGYDKSHFQRGNWCPDGSFLTQLDLDGDTSHGDHNGPIVGRAKCCTLPEGQFQKWGTSYWQEVGGLMSHNDLENWCPHGTFVTQLDWDGVAGSAYDSPVVGRCKCTRPAQGVIFADLTSVTLNTAGNTDTVTISGGLAPYTIQTAPDSATATAELSGTVLTIAAVADGSTSVVITDSQVPAYTVTIPITVGAGAAGPVPDIKANGLDGPITLSQSDLLAVTLALDNDGITDNADWWLAAVTPYGSYFFTFEGWVTNWLPVYQGPLFPVPPIELSSVPLSGFPVGTYGFYFGVDTHMDKIITLDNLYFDSVLINLVSGPTIEDLKGPEWENYIGETVTVEGIFVRDPLPMLVTNLDLVKVNMPTPEDQYIILLGNNAEEIDPKEYGGARLKLTGIVSTVDDNETYMGEHVGIQVISFEMIELLEKYCPEVTEIQIFPPEIQQPHSWAILFSGGIKPSSNRTRYWNDLKFMYSTLINEYGYIAEHIAVLYADGNGRDTGMPVHYSATQTNLETVFNLLGQHSTQDDLIFIFTTNHGGGFYKQGSIWCDYNHICGGSLDSGLDEPSSDILSEANYNLDLNANGNKNDQVSWDEELCAWGGSIFDDAFPNMLANLEYNRMVIVMEQCFSGGLIADMAGTNRIIMSAAGEYEFSWSMNGYDEFSYYFTCAINGADPTGKTVNADTNSDGQVSMVEAFNYARSNDTQSETPRYEDNGDGDSHPGPIPAGGDGTLGSNTFL